jgi:hypothetical protein
MRLYRDRRLRLLADRGLYKIVPAPSVGNVQSHDAQGDDPEKSVRMSWARAVANPAEREGFEPSDPG